MTDRRDAADGRRLVLAVDGGNSKADVALVTEDGQLLGARRGPSISHQAVPLATAAGRLGRLVAALDAPRRPTAAVHCLAGADYPTDVRLLRDAFAAVAPAGETIVLNDTFAALRAGSDAPSGIALICGQGINGAAVGRDGRRHRFAGVGDIAGDWGGGGAVGMAGLAAAVRGRDGRGPRTSLERTIPAAVGMARPGSVTRAYYEGRLDQHRIGDLAPTVFATAAAGDAVARAIVDRLADELATMAGALARRAALIRQRPTVVLAGGVFRTDDDAFHARLAAGLERAIPGARPVRLTAPPVLGSALIGLDRLAGGAAAPAAEATIRRAIAAWNATGPVVTSS
ncbi:MAG TPA: BadF/BadG/BcrA/BcrD ATPase family protein [Candidatus Limnocylindrales bacterium]|nr:BadF/BadG/BcrA/BcrD ATPase family protein [Candidatus Limnocylindrales bacterium]